VNEYGRFHNFTQRILAHLFHLISQTLDDFKENLSAVSGYKSFSLAMDFGTKLS